jgi:hypothetical protein
MRRSLRARRTCASSRAGRRWTGGWGPAAAPLQRRCCSELEGPARAARHALPRSAGARRALRPGAGELKPRPPAPCAPRTKIQEMADQILAQQAAQEQQQRQQGPDGSAAGAGAGAASQPSSGRPPPLAAVPLMDTHFNSLSSRPARRMAGARRARALRAARCTPRPGPPPAFRCRAPPSVHGRHLCTCPAAGSNEPPTCTHPARHLRLPAPPCRQEGQGRRGQGPGASWRAQRADVAQAGLAAARQPRAGGGCQAGQPAGRQRHLPLRALAGWVGRRALRAWCQPGEAGVAAGLRWRGSAPAGLAPAGRAPAAALLQRWRRALQPAAPPVPPHPQPPPGPALQRRTATTCTPAASGAPPARRCCG